MLPLRRHAAATLLVFGLASLPSCLTAKMWASYEPSPPEVLVELAEEHEGYRIGMLRGADPVAENGLFWQPRRDGGPGWWLRPAEGAVVAAALLADAELCDVEGGRLSALHSFLDRDLQADDARLELQLVVHPEALAKVVSPSEVRPSTRRALLRSKGSAFLPSRFADRALPALLQRCAERMRAVDLGRVLGGEHAWRLASWVFVDEAGRPWSAAAPLVGPDAAVGERLAALREVELLVRMTGAGGEEHLLRVRADRLWLCSALERRDELYVHRSDWQLQFAPRWGTAWPDDSVPSVLTTLSLQQRQYRRTSR